MFRSPIAAVVNGLVIAESSKVEIVNARYCVASPRKRAPLADVAGP